MAWTREGGTSVASELREEFIFGEQEQDRAAAEAASSGRRAGRRRRGRAGRARTGGGRRSGRAAQGQAGRARGSGRRRGGRSRRGRSSCGRGATSTTDSISWSGARAAPQAASSALREALERGHEEPSRRRTRRAGRLDHGRRAPPERVGADRSAKHGRDRRCGHARGRWTPLLHLRLLALEHRSPAPRRRPASPVKEYDVGDCSRIVYRDRMVFPPILDSSV